MARVEHERVTERFAGVRGQQRLSKNAGQYTSSIDDKLSFSIDNIEREYEHITTTWTVDYLESKRRTESIK
jgi:hypothetical protein